MFNQNSGYNNPQDALSAPDSWTRKMALAAIARNPVSADREVFEEYVGSDDPCLSLLGFLGLKKLFPSPTPTRDAWKDLFGESVDLLTKRACSGPAQMRVAALKALAFAPECLTLGLVETVLDSLEEPVSYKSICVGQSPSLALVQNPETFFLPEGFALLLSSLPGNYDRKQLLQRELISEEPARLLPVLISLQLKPINELTESILSLARSTDERVSTEASRALLACGGNKVFLLILSLLKETADPLKKARLLPLAANTGKQEVWPHIVKYSASKNSTLATAALESADIFAIAVEEKAEIFKKAMKSQLPEVACMAAKFAWKLGSLESLRLLESSINSKDKNWRMFSARALGNLPSDLSIPILSKKFDNEHSGDVTREIILSLRKLLPQTVDNPRALDITLPWLSRMIYSTDPFKRSQSALMCGLVGSNGIDVILKAIEKEKHPHVIASILGALGRNSVDKMLVYSKFHDHEDARVKANMLAAMLTCGGSAVPYFSHALKDSSPRVRSIAAKNLFLLGQLDIVGTLNRMLLVPEPVSVLSGCYGLAQLLRIQPPLLSSDHPLPLSVARKVIAKTKRLVNGPFLLTSYEVSELFNEMAAVGGDKKKLLKLLKHKHKVHPQAHTIKRLLASFCIENGDYKTASNLILSGVGDYPNVLADLMDLYRLSLKLGKLDDAREYGNRTKELYKKLLEGCKDLCMSLRGSGAEKLLETLHHLREPSMNLYNAMIQLKIIEGDLETVLELLAELVIARPLNQILLQRLGQLMPLTVGRLKKNILAYAVSIPANKK